VTVSPRALLIIAPALFVVGGSFWLSRADLREINRAVDGRDSVQDGLVLPPGAADEDILHRVALKLEIIDDLFDGRITLQEAVLQFESLNEAGGNDSTPDSTASNDSSLSRAVAQVLSYARNEARYEPKQRQAAMDRIEAEAVTLLAETTSKADPTLVR
jgi:hypothetical protein